MKSRVSFIGTGLLLIVLLSTQCSRAQTESSSIGNSIAQTQLAYVVSFGLNSEIQIANLLDEIRVMQVEGNARSLKWSPNGQYLAWVVYDYQTHQSSLWVMNTDDAITLIVSWTENVIGFWWSPYSRSLFVIEFDSDSGKKLDVYGLSISAQQRTSVWFESLPFNTFIDFAISPDWQHVAYMQKGTSTLVVRNKNGDTWHIFDLPLGVHGFESLVWSLDSQRLAFSASDADYVQINVFTSRFNGEELEQLTSGVGAGIRTVLAWAPSGNYLAFSLIDSEDGNQLCYINTKVTESSPHCIKAIWAGGRLQWISDNEWFLTTNRVDGQWDIYRVSLVDETITNLTQDNEVESGLTFRILD